MMAESLPPSITGRVEVDLALEDQAWLGDVPDVRAAVTSAATATLDEACPGPALTLAVVLADDTTLQGLNLRWRNIDRPTNVLSFPTEDLEAGAVPQAPAGAPADLGIELGDVVLARETVLREARDGALSPEHHLMHLVVHGTLHLLGYDHEHDLEAERMETLEAAVLAGLGVSNPYV